MRSRAPRHARSLRSTRLRRYLRPLTSAGTAIALVVALSSAGPVGGSGSTALATPKAKTQKPMASINAHPAAFNLAPGCEADTVDPNTVYCNWVYNGSDVNFNVPAGVRSINFAVAGAQGGSSGGHSGGYGGIVTGSIDTVDNEVLTLRVPGSPTDRTGGWPDGGNGGSSNSNNGCGGGGSAQIVNDAGTVLVVAGGGGGCGANTYNGYGNGGGAGGGGTGGGGGANRGGSSLSTCHNPGGNGGGGGGQSGGGVGGAGGQVIDVFTCSDHGSGGGGGGRTGGGGGGTGKGLSTATVNADFGGGGGGGGGGWYGGGGGGGGGYAGGGAGGGGGSNGWYSSYVHALQSQGSQSGNGSVSLSYTRVATTTTVQANAGVYPGSTQTLLASVSPANVDPGSSVSFTVDGNAIACDSGLSYVSGGQAWCTFTQPLAVGQSNVVAYFSGDSGNQPSQGTTSYTVAKAPTYTQIGTVTAPTPNSLSFPITVTPAVGAVTLDGSVYADVLSGDGNGCVNLALPSVDPGASATVTCVITGLPAGTTQTINAGYGYGSVTANSGDTRSGVATPKQSTAVALSIAPTGGTFGDKATLSGSVTTNGSQAPAGTVTIYRVDGAVAAGDSYTPGPVACSVTPTTSNATLSFSCDIVPGGDDSYYVADYAGDSGTTASHSASASYNAAAASTTTSLDVFGAAASGGAYSATVGDQLTFTSTTLYNTPALKGQNAPAGHTQILDGQKVICDVATTCVLSDLGVGAHTIRARYLGTTTAATSDSGVITVNVRTASATLALTNSGTQPAGQPVTLTATLTTAATAAGGGTVTFYDRANPSVTLCSKALPANRIATCTTTPVPGAAVAYEASYTGDTITGTVTSNTSAYTSSPATTTTTVSATPAGGTAFGTAVTLTATVTSAATTPRATPNGTVTFKSGTTTLCTAVPVVGGASAGVATAACATAALRAGTPTVTATYSATAATGASSGSKAVTITGAPTTTTVSTVNAQSGVTASVTVAAAGVVPAGSVVVRLGSASGAAQCTIAALDASGSGSCTFALPKAGSYTYVAVFAPSGNDFNGSSNSVVDVVGAADQPCSGGFADLWAKAKANPTLDVVGSGLGTLGMTVSGSLGTCNQAAALTFTANLSLFGTSLTGSGVTGVATQTGGLCLTKGTIGLPAAYHAGNLTITSAICFDLAPGALLSTLRGGSMAAAPNATTPFFTVPGIGTVGLTLTAGHTSAGNPTLTIATTVGGSTVSATMSATIAGDGSVDGTLTTSGLSVFDQPLALDGDFSRTPGGAITSHVTATIAGPFDLVTGVTLHDLTATLGTDGLAVTGNADLGSSDKPIEISVSGAFTSLKDWTLHVTSENTSWTPVDGLTFTPNFDGTITSTAGEYDYDITASGPGGKGLATWTPGPGVSIAVDSINLSNGTTDCGTGDPVLTMAGSVTAGPVDATLGGCVDLATREFSLTAASSSVPVASGLTLTDFAATITRTAGGVRFRGNATGHVDVGGKTLTVPFSILVTSTGDTVVGAGVDLTSLGLPVSKGYLAYASSAQDSFDTGIADLAGGSVISLPEGLSARGVVSVPRALATALSQGGFTVGNDLQIAFEASLSKTAGLKFHGELSGPDSMPFLTLPGGSTLNSATLDYADGTLSMGASASIANDSGDPADAELSVTFSKDGSFSGDASVKGLLILGHSVDLAGTVAKPAGGTLTASITATIPGPVTFDSGVPVSLSAITVTIGTEGLSFAGDLSVADSADLSVEGEFNSMKRWSLTVDGDSGSWSPTDGVTLDAHLSGSLVHDATVAAGKPTTTVHLIATGAHGNPLFSITPTSSVALAVNSIAIGNDAAPADCPTDTTTGDLYFAIDGGLSFDLASASGEVDGAGCFNITKKSFEFSAAVPSATVSALGGAVHIDSLVVSIGREVDNGKSVFTASAEGRLAINMPFGGQVSFTAQMVLSGGDFAIGASVDLSKYLGAKAANAYLYYSSAPITLTVPNPTIGKVTLKAGVTVALSLALTADQTSLLSKIGLTTASGVKLSAIGTIDFVNKVVALNVKLDLGIEGQTIFGDPNNRNAASMQFLSGGLQLVISPTVFSIGISATVRLLLPPATPSSQPSSVDLTGMFTVSNTAITVSLSTDRWNDAFGTAGLNLRFLAVQGGITFTGLPSFGFAASVDHLPDNVATAIGYTQGAPITIALNLSVTSFILKLEIGTQNSGITALAPLTAVGAPDLVKVDYGLLYISPNGGTIGTQVFSPGFEIAVQATIFGVSVDIDAKIDPVKLAIYFKADIGAIHLGAMTIGPTSVLLDASVADKKFIFQFSGALQLGPGSTQIGPALRVSGSAHADVTVSIGTTGFAVHGNFSLSVAMSFNLPQDVCYYKGFLPYPCDYEWKDQSPVNVTLNNLGFAVDKSGVTLDVPNTTYTITLPFPGGSGSDYRTNTAGFRRNAAAAKAPTTATDKAPRVKGDWAASGILNQGRAFAATAALPNGDALVAGGASAATVLNSAEAYDATTGKWGAIAAMPLGVATASTVTLPDGRVLVLGGATNGGPVAAAQSYDPATGRWALLAPMQQARQASTATVLGDGTVLVVGGRTRAGGPTATAEIYHPSTNTWTGAAAMPGARTFASAGLLKDGTVLVAGGISTAPLASAAVYTPSTNTWTTVGSLAVPRFGASVVPLTSGGALVTGGAAQAEIYRPGAQRFGAAGLQSASPQFGSAVPMADGRVLSVGGLVAGRGLTQTQVYSPASNSWASAQALPGARGAASAVLLGTGNVLVTGGTTGGDVTGPARDSTEVFALPKAPHVPDGGSSSPLANTGVKASPPAWLLIGSMLILLGAVLTVGARRRRRVRV